MNDQTIKDAFTFGAGDAEPSEALWERVEKEIHTRPRWALWRRVALACASVAAALMLVMAASPTARAVVEKLVTTVWSGKLGSVPTKVQQIDATATFKEMIEAGVATSRPVQQFRFSSLEEAAAKAGFRPLEVRDSRVTFEAATVFLDPLEASDSKSGVVHVTYKVGGETYTVVSMAMFKKRGDTWEPFPPPSFTLTVPSSGPLAPSPVMLGSREVVCTEADEPTLGKQNFCTWTEGAVQVVVMGPDPKLTQEIAASVVAK